MNYNNLAQPWQQSAQNTPRLPLRSNSTFFLKHHPRNWELIAFDLPSKNKKAATKKHLWLPVLHNHIETAGVEGVRGAERGGAVDSSLAKAKYSRDGWTILEPSKFDYLRIYPALNGNYHCDVWTQLENLGGEIVTTYDHDAHNKFRRELVLMEVIPLPHTQILKRLIHKHSRMISNKSKYQHIPENKKKLDIMHDINRAMVEAMDDVKATGVKSYEL